MLCRAEGTVFGLLGANGAGKSTAIECILGTKKADGGTVEILRASSEKDRKRLFERVGVQFQEANYQEAICAGGVMGLPLVISDYRGKHILKRFRVTPVSPSVILLVQVTIYALYSLVSLISLFAVAKLFFGFALRGSVPLFLLGWLLVMVSMFSIGMMVGGIAKNNKIAGIIASILYFPMLIFSGATLPYEVMPSVMQRITDILPLTQGIKILKAVTQGIPTDSIVLPLIVMSVVTAVCTFVSLKWFRWE